MIVAKKTQMQMNDRTHDQHLPNPISTNASPCQAQTTCTIHSMFHRKSRTGKTRRETLNPPQQQTCSVPSTAVQTSTAKTAPATPAQSR